MIYLQHNQDEQIVELDDPQIEENMQNNGEAPASGLQSKGYPHKQQCNGSPMQGFIPLKTDIYTHGNPNNLELNGTKTTELPESSIEYNKKPAYFGSWSLHPEPKKANFCHFNGIEGHFYPFLVNNRVQYAPFTTFPQSYPCDYQFQEFHYFVVIDFEATCDKERNPHPQEIIEFPSVIVSSVTGQLEACFQTYVRPTCNQLLTDFCKDLTGIEQIQVDRGVTLSEALLRHDKWLEKKGIKNTNFAVVTWSNWDCRVMLESECRFKKIHKPPYFNRWINLKVPFHEVFGGVKCNLKEAVQMAGLSWQGRPHCGLDDAKNTARLLSLIMHKGFKFAITNSLMCHHSTATNHHTFTLKPPLTAMPFPPYHQKDLHFFPIFHPCCFCGVKSSKVMVRKPGPKQGSCFFGCGNWTSARGARCQFFEWA